MVENGEWMVGASRSARRGPGSPDVLVLSAPGTAALFWDPAAVAVRAAASVRER